MRELIRTSCNEEEVILGTVSETILPVKASLECYGKNGGECEF